MLDLLPPEPERLEAAVAFIREHIGQGKFYVHCALGYSRSAQVAARYLQQTGLSPEAAVWTLRKTRPRVLLSPTLEQA
jgi:protein-tyrosine phosphatase